MLPARQYWPSLCLNSRSGPQGISTNIGLPKGGLLDYNDDYKEYDECGNYVDDIAQGVTQWTQMCGGIIVHKCRSAA